MTGLLPANELAALQQAAEEILDTPITVSRTSAATATTTDGYGHQAATTTTQVASVNALFTRPSGPVLAEIASKIGALVVWVMSVSTATDIATDDTVTVTATGETFTVQIAQTPQSYSPLLSVIVAKVR